MKARSQRTHYMGQSNRNSHSVISTDRKNINKTFDILQKSFNKTQSQYYHTKLNKISSTITSSVKNNNTNYKAPSVMRNTLGQENINLPNYSSQLNINSIYKDSEKGHHFEFENKNFTNNKIPSNFTSLNRKNSQSFQPILNPPPLNMNSKLNSSIQQIKSLLISNLNNSQPNKVSQQNSFSINLNEEINLHKIKQLKKTFLRNNQKRKNLKSYFYQFANKHTNKIDKKGFKSLIKTYGYDINDTEIDLIFSLNSTVHDEQSPNQSNLQISNNKIQQIDLPQFVNLMTKENVYFQTIQLPKNLQQNTQSYRLPPCEFQILRNKYPKLKQALKIYKDQPITRQKFEKIMKKLDITDLVLKQNKRQQIFNNFSQNNKNQLNVQKLLGIIVTQEHERISKEKQMTLTNYDNFEQNIPANEEYKFEKTNKNDPLLELLYPKNIKTASFLDYEKSVKQARDICQCLKEINKKQKDVIKVILQNETKLTKDQLYKRIERILQEQGYNFNSNEYKSFISYIDFDSNDKVSKQKLENLILYQNEPKIVNRLDRRLRNQDQSQKSSSNNRELKNPQDQFVDKMRNKSTCDWNTIKKTIIKDDNNAEFKVPTKFSAWPQRLYQTDLSLIQSKGSFGMGIDESSRFQKEDKHRFGQEQRLKRLLNYENKVRKVAQWQQMNSRKIEDICRAEARKQQSRLYNLRLLKEQYEQRCHSKSFAQ